MLRVCVCLQLSRVRFFVTPWTTACQVPLSIGYSRQEYWTGLPYTSPGDLSQPGDQTYISCIGRLVLYHWHHQINIIGILITRKSLKAQTHTHRKWVLCEDKSRDPCDATAFQGMLMILSKAGEAKEKGIEWCLGHGTQRELILMSS